MTRDSNKRWWILGAMGAVLGVILLDETVVAVALPTIRKDLGLSVLTGHWIVNIYLMTLAGLACAAGRLADILGARALISAGLVIFGASSAYGGFAATGSDLLVARMLQGVGAAMIFPLSLVLVSMSFPESERGKALGIYGAIGTSFLAMGPLVGGLLTEYLSWRWIFWVNPPIVLGVAIVTLLSWRDPPHDRETEFDWRGLILLVGGLSLTVFALMEGPDRGWSQPDVFLPLGVGLLCLALLGPAERHRAYPLLAVKLFADGTFTASNLIVFCAKFLKISVFVFGAMYFQTEVGLSPLMAGLALLPSVLPPMFIAVWVGKISDTIGTRLPSLAGVFGAMLCLSAIALGTGEKSQLVVFAGLLMVGVSLPFMFTPPRNAVMSTVAPGMHGQASGITMTAQLLGGTIGMAICSMVYSVTGSFPAVFMATALLCAAVFVIGFFAIKAPKREAAV
ncbi:MAG: MFS transporter [Pseudomonadota bacterium]